MKFKWGTCKLPDSPTNQRTIVINLFFRLIFLFLFSNAFLYMLSLLPLSLEELEHFTFSFRPESSDSFLQLPVTLYTFISR